MPRNQAANDPASGLIFMLAQLRDDLSEIIEAVEFKSVPVETAVEAAKAQLEWVLKELTVD